jgi:hypothetical protein
VVVSKIFRTDAIKRTIRIIGRNHPRSSSLPHVDTGPTISFIFGTLPDTLTEMSEYQALSGIRPGSPQWYQTSVLSASFSFLEVGRSHRVPNQGIRLVGDDSHFVFRQKLLGEDGSVRRGVVMVKQPGLFSPKCKATSSYVFTQSPQNVAVEPGIHSLACWNRCFSLPQLLYRWRHQSGIVWIPSRMEVQPLWQKATSSSVGQIANVQV